jgi:quinol monooxygenase YgiN
MAIRPNDSTTTARTLIHVFPTTERTQLPVLALLRRVTAAVFAPEHGFLGVALAHSVDGERIVMQSEWSDLADFRRALRTPLGVAYWRRVRALLARDGGDRATDVRVYDDRLSFYSLGVVTAHGVPPPQAAPIATSVF